MEQLGTLFIIFVWDPLLQETLPATLVAICCQILVITLIAFWHLMHRESGISFWHLMTINFKESMHTEHGTTDDAHGGHDHDVAADTHDVDNNDFVKCQAIPSFPSPSQGGDTIFGWSRPQVMPMVRWILCSWLSLMEKRVAAAIQ
jgi:hypothetical protein